MICTVLNGCQVNIALSRVRALFWAGLKASWQMKNEHNGGNLKIIYPKDQQFMLLKSLAGHQIILLFTILIIFTKFISQGAVKGSIGDNSTYLM